MKGVSMKNDVYTIITDRIIELLEQDIIPWKKPWRGTSDFPRNLISKKIYRGINIFILFSVGYSSPYWLTFRQAKSLGGSVKKGQRGYPIVFWKKHQVEDRVTGDTKQIPFLRYYTVFNVDQCENLDESKIPEQEKVQNLDFKPIADCEEIYANMPNRPGITEGPNADYNPVTDQIRMPGRSRFESEVEFYSTQFHELVHSTGHQSRLNRPELTKTTNFGSQTYSKEELVAEMGSAILCGIANISPSVIEHQAAYIKGWLKKLREDKKVVVNAAAQAHKAADYILNMQNNHEEGTASFS